MEQGLFFENPGESCLFGVVGLPERPGRIGVLFCHSFSDEAQNSYRTLVDISRYLLEQGVPVLRFDCAGFGESGDELISTTVSSMVRDTQAASQMLCEKAGIDKIVLVGIRFGAITAMLSAEKIPEVAGVVLVSPVTDGNKFANDLIRAVQFAELATAKKASERSIITQRLKHDESLEVEGSLISQRMFTEISNTNLIENPVNYRGPLAVSLIPGNRQDQKVKHLASTYQTLGCVTETWNSDSSLFWTNLAMFNPQSPKILNQNLVRWLSCLS